MRERKGNMLEEMRDFLLDERLAEEAKSAFGEMFGSTEVFDELYDEMHDVALAWRPPLHLKQTNIVFSVMVPIRDDAVRKWPLSDLMKIKIDNIAMIPEYIRNHPYADTADQILDEGWTFTAPLILTTTDDLLSSWAYILDDEERYRPAMLAAILYEMSLLDGTIEGSDVRKHSMINEMEKSSSTDHNVTIDDLLIEAGHTTGEKNNNKTNSTFETLALSRYNARLETYERLHFDMAQAVLQDKQVRKVSTDAKS